MANIGSGGGVTTSRTITNWLLTFFLSLTVSSCAAPLSTREKGALGGTTLGAGAGAIIGAMTGATIVGTLIGAGLGGLTGTIVGDQVQGQQQALQAEQQRQLEEQRQQIERQKAEIERLGKPQREEGDDGEVSPSGHPAAPTGGEPRGQQPEGGTGGKEVIY